MDKYFEPINKLYLSQPFTEKEDERKQEEAFHKELLLLGGNRSLSTTFSKAFSTRLRIAGKSPCLSGLIVIPALYAGTIVLLRHDVEMLCPLIAERRNYAMIRMMEPEAAFLYNPFRLCVPVIISAPRGIKVQVAEASCQQGRDSLGDEALSPIGLAYPVANLRFARLHLSRVKTIGEHYPATADRLARGFKHDRIRFGSGEDRPDNLPAVFHRRVGRPSGNGTDVRVARVLEHCLGIRFLPRSED